MSDDSGDQRQDDENNEKAIEKEMLGKKTFEKVKSFAIEEGNLLSNKLKVANDNLQKSGFGKAAKRVKDKMKPVTSMSESDLLEVALYNFLVMLFELLFGVKKGVTKIPGGIRSLFDENPNKKDGDYRRDAKNAHGENLEKASELKTEIEELEKSKEGMENVEDRKEVDKKIKEKNKEYDKALGGIAKAESLYQKHGIDARETKLESAKKELDELRPKLEQAKEKYKEDKKEFNKIIKPTALQSDNFNQQKAKLNELKIEKASLKVKIKKLEKNLKKAPKRLDKMKGAANELHNNEGKMDSSREIQEKINNVEKLSEKSANLLEEGNALNDKKKNLEKNVKQIKAELKELKKLPEDEKTHQQIKDESQFKKQLDKVRNELQSLNGVEATLNNRVEKLTKDKEKFDALPQETKAEKSKKGENINAKLEAANKELAKYREIPIALNTEKIKLETEKKNFVRRDGETDDQLNERKNELEAKLENVDKRINNHNNKSKGEIALHKEKRDALMDTINNKMLEIDKGMALNTPILKVSSPKLESNPSLGTSQLQSAVSNPGTPILKVSSPKNPAIQNTANNSPADAKLAVSENLTDQTQLFQTSSENRLESVNKVNIDPAKNEAVVQNAVLLSNSDSGPSSSPEMAEAFSTSVAETKPKPTNNAHIHESRQKAEIAQYDKLLEAFNSLKPSNNPQTLNFSKLELALTVLMKGGGDIAEMNKLANDMDKNIAYRPAMLTSPEPAQRQVGCYAVLAHAYLIAESKTFDDLIPKEKDILKRMAMELGKDDGTGGSSLKSLTVSNVENAFQKVVAEMKQNEMPKVLEVKEPEIKDGSGKKLPDTPPPKSGGGALGGLFGKK